MGNDFIKIREELQRLDAAGGGEYSEAVVSYFKYYSLNLEDDFNGLEHVFGTFESQGQLLAGHIFKPKEYKATVFVLHGYLNHCSQMKYLIRFLVEQGYAVAAFDLPGHGLSAGERASIEDFSQYGDALSDFANVVTNQVQGPYHIVAFSTGASAAIEYLFAGQDDIFDKVILAAPLIHFIGWEQSKVGFKFYNSFADSLPRVPRKECSNKQYLNFVKADALQIRTVPLQWVKALYEWNDRIAEAAVCDRRVKVIQGKKDKTVGWKFNIEFIKEKFSDVEVSLIDNCRHELFNEAVDIRKEVFSQVNSYLDS